MTVLDRLLEIGVRCPCGGEINLVDGLYGWADASCDTCGIIAMSTQEEDAVDILTRWFVLTGGPIPKDVRPPGRRYRYDEDYYLEAWQRTPAIIRSWLESEVTT